MSDLDRKIRDALAEEEAELLEQFGEPSLPEQVRDSFRGRSRWLVAVTFAATVGYMALAVVSAVRFFQAEEVQAMIAWAVAFGVSLLSIALMKIWYWMELNRNAVTREVKRLELQVARLASQLRKPDAESAR